jgi:phosphatidylinositol alpha 1,6-mannosyltransferase
MDLFVFPSETDTYGNVISESLASGTPVVVTSKGGPKFQVQPGITGYVAEDGEDFIAKVKLLVTNPDRCRGLREACRKWATGKSWDAVLDDLHDAYQAGFASPAVQPAASALATN